MVTRLFAPVKINLSLRLIGRRADGYHDLSSFIVFGDYGDTITPAPATERTLAITGKHRATLSAGGDNLVNRAIDLCEAATGKKFTATITIEKNIPIGGGLGGGTSNGVAMIKYLGQLWHIAPSEQAAMARQIGADGAALFYGKPCLATGVGEVITPAPLPAWLATATILLVWDGTAVSTRAVFAAWDGQEKTNNIDEGAGAGANRGQEEQSPTAVDLSEAQKTWGNDLTPPAMKLHPNLRRVATALAAQEGCQLTNMTGSGGCFYALFANDRQAAKAAEFCQQQQWWAVRCGLMA